MEIYLIIKVYLSCLRKIILHIHFFWLKIDYYIGKYCSYKLFRRQMFFFVVIYVFDAQNGKPLGDGKPITHKVHYHTTVIVFPLSFRNGQWDLSICSVHMSHHWSLFYSWRWWRSLWTSVDRQQREDWPSLTKTETCTWPLSECSAPRGSPTS